MYVLNTSGWQILNEVCYLLLHWYSVYCYRENLHPIP